MKFTDKRVLIIEDQRPFLLLLRGLLNSMGATDVVTKPSAEQAIAICRRQKFDIIIADLHLGSDKKTGYELIEELRYRKFIKPSTIFLLISADSARPVVLGSLERRPDDYLIKPFSQSQLKSRIARAWQKRQYMLVVFRAIFEEDWDTAIAACQTLVNTDSPYRRYCEQALVELYWQVNQPEKALEVLNSYQSGKPVLWAQIALGRTYLKLEQPQQALDVAQTILQTNRFSAEAYDLIAEAQNHMQDGEQAITAIRQAIKLSPFSLPRHFTACAIARDHQDFLLASESSLAIWQLSRRTIHQDITHWCGYIRSVLDAAEHAEDKRTRNRFQQEALLVVQRGKFDDVLLRLDEEFDLDIYEQVVNARINSLDGKMLDAKRELVTAQFAIEDKFEQYPKAYAPDSIKVMYDLGEFDDARDLLQTLRNSETGLDPGSEQRLKYESRRAAERQNLYQQHNRQGIEYYQQGQYGRARESFTLALQFAPVNTGVALNLLQCLLKVLSQQKKIDPSLIKECRKVYKLVEDIPLRSQHQEKYNDLKGELLGYLGK